MGCKCSSTSSTSNCTSGCKSTMNTDCVIYNQAVLPFEDPSTSASSNRTLTALLQQIINSNSKESKIIKFNADGTTDNGSTYTVIAEDTTKVLLITQTDDASEGSVIYTINLPQTEEFIDQELIFKDISTALDSEATTVEYRFNISIQYEWQPVASTNLFYTLSDSTHKTLKLRFVKTTPTSYQWIVCP